MSHELNPSAAVFYEEVAETALVMDDLDAESAPRARSASEVDEPELDIMISTPTTRGNPLPLVRQESSDREYRHPEHIADVDEYPRVTCEDLGVVLIFNFDTFQSLAARNGSRLDVRSLCECLTRLKFSIDKAQCFNNLTRKEVIKAIRSTLRTISKPNIIIAVFLSHGSENNLISTYDCPMSVEEIVSLFDQVQLRGVPKWLTFAACKATEKHQPKLPEQAIVPQSVFNHRLPDDFIIYFSTTEGNFAVREEEGTWVIQELCTNLRAYGERQDLFAILTRTNKCVANNYVAETRQNMRIAPTIISTLRKKLFLTASKERRAILEIHKLLGEIKQALNFR